MRQEYGYSLTSKRCLQFFSHHNRFNRRNSRSRGMLFFRVLQLAVMHEPVRYDDLIVERRPLKVAPKAPVRRGRTPTLDRPSVDRPWRRA